MATLKDGKIVFSQKSLRWDETTTALKEIIAFSDYLKDPSTTTPLTRLPTEHHPLLAKLIHESDKAIAALTKHVKRLLMRRCDGSLTTDDKALLEDPRIPIDAITIAINDVAGRVNYGIEGAPAALSLWRWEVKDLESMLPSPSEEPSCNSVLAKQRQQERVEARDALKATFEALPEEEKERILKKQPRKKADEPSTSTSVDTGAVKESPKVSRKSGSENKQVAEAKEAKPKVPAVVKETKPKNNKQAQMMSNFFKAPSKPKVAPVNSIATPSQSDFEKTFKPFLVKKDTKVAPISRFLEERQNGGGKGKGKEKNRNLVVLDDDGDVEMEIIEIDSAPSSPTKSAAGVMNDDDDDVSDLTPRDLLSQFLSSVPSSRLVSRNRKAPPTQGPLKTNWSPSRSVRNVMNQLTEAEVMGDTKATRKLQRLLKDRKRIPGKLLQFHDNARPGYYGTWTKSSTQVGPRTPFGKDLVAFDYSYDSGQEWEDEPEDAEEVTGVEEDSDVAEDDEDEGEFDDFLVPDDEIEEGAESEPRRSLSPCAIDGAEKNVVGQGVKRKAGKEKENKKKKVFKPLIPYTAGPCWEKRIGECTDTFKVFRIQLLNDTPFPINPFTWVSEPVVLTEQPAASAVTVNTAQITVNGVPASESTDGFAVPALPPHLHPSTQMNLPPNPNVLSPSLDKLSISSTPAQPPKPKAQAKPFPQLYLHELFQLIHGSTDTKVVLVDKIATHFRTKEEDEVKRKLKKKREVVKGVVEAAVKDFAMKVEKTWKVKDEAWLAAGVSPPVVA